MLNKKIKKALYIKTPFFQYNSQSEKEFYTSIDIDRCQWRYDVRPIAYAALQT